MRALMIAATLVSVGCTDKADETATMNIEAMTAMDAQLAAPPANEAGTPYSVPADPNASYLLLSVKRGSGGNIIAMTRRTGSCGTSYSNREINCRSQLARYIGEGDTLAEAEQPSPNPGEMSSLVEGSSTHAAVQAACANR